MAVSVNEIRKIEFSDHVYITVVLCNWNFLTYSPAAQLGEPDQEIHPVNEFPGKRRVSGRRGWCLKELLFSAMDGMNNLSYSPVAQSVERVTVNH